MSARWCRGTLLASAVACTAAVTVACGGGVLTGPADLPPVTLDTAPTDEGLVAIDILEFAHSEVTPDIAPAPCALRGTFGVQSLTCLKQDQTLPFLAAVASASIEITEGPDGACHARRVLLAGACAKTDSWTFQDEGGFWSFDFAGLEACDPVGCTFGSGDPACAVGGAPKGTAQGLVTVDANDVVVQWTGPAGDWCTDLGKTPALWKLGATRLHFATPGGIPGASIGATGDGFQPSEPVTLRLDAKDTALASATADASGIVKTTFPVPQGFDPGPILVRMEGQVARIPAFAALTVRYQGTLALDPASPGPDTTVHAQLAGFESGEKVELRWDVATTGPLLGTATIDATGHAKVDIQIPVGALPGKHTVLATGLSSKSVAQDDLGLVYAPTLQLSTSKAAHGADVGVTGAGFLAGELIDLRMDSDTTPFQPAIPATAQGLLSTVFKVPGGLPAGSHTVHARGQQSLVDATASLQVL